MSSIQFVVHPLPGTEDQLNDRLREVSDKINKYGSQMAPAFQSLKSPVKQIVIGPNHLGILLEDGRAFRVAFSVIPERLDLSKQEPSKNNGSGGSGSANNQSGGSKNSPGTSRQLARSRARIMRTTSNVRIGSSSQGSGSRSTGVIIGGGSSGRSLVAVPAPFVPEELVTQAQVVLQGKSRNMIIRELQRTNLDVNLAVNNLLSRDDEEGEDTEEGGDNYVPEDLISLLDSGFHDNSVIIDADAMFSEDMFGYSSMRRGSRGGGSGGGVGASGDRSQSTMGSGSGSGTGGASGENSGGRPVSGSVAAGSAGGGATGAGGSAGVGGGSGGAGAGSANVGSGAPGTAGSSAPGVERDVFSRWRDRQYFNPRRWFQNSRDDSNWERESDSKKKEISSGLPLWISDELEPWPEKDVSIRFTQVAALHSEFIGVTAKGELHQWKWSEPEPFRHAENQNIFHPKTQQLNLNYEKVILISATLIRCTVATENGRLATWMDDLLGQAGSKLEHTAMNLVDFDKIVSLHTCTLYTVARTENGNLFWWGVLPYGQRKRLWDKYRAKSRKPVRPNANAPEVTVGAQVCMKNSPMYQPGAIGFTISNGVPKVGQLMNAAWDLGDVCRFKLVSVPIASTAGSLLTSELKDFSKSNSSSSTANNLSEKSTPATSATQAKQSTAASSNSNNKENADRLDMPPPPSPASSTCSDTGSVTSHKRHKRMTPKDDGESKKDEESWQLRDVVFVEDVRSIPIGRVLKVDGAYAAVKFPTLTSAGGSKEVKDESDAWQDCRLMRKDDLQVIKSTTTSRVPDCFQKTPRRVVPSPLAQSTTESINSQLLTLTVDSKGIHAIMKINNKLHYTLFNLITGRQEHDSIFPTDINAFLGSCPSNISLTCAGECSDAVLILRDGNNTIYPMTKDCVEAIKDPNWLDLPPIKCIAAAPLTLPSVGVNMKSQVAIVAIVPEPQILMTRILRCDIEGIRNVLSLMEGDLKYQINQVLAEKCDGNRNIFHTCVSMCSPSSNKDPEQEIPGNSQQSASGGGVGGGGGSNQSSTGGLECINVITNAFSGTRPVSIREMMRRATQTIRDSDSSPSNANAAPPGINEDAPTLPIVYWPPEYDPASGDEDSLTGLNTSQSSSSQDRHQKPAMANNYISDTSERRNNAVLSLSLMCESPVLQPYLRQLLSAKDAQGQTPFMLAVSCRAYQAGIILFNAIMKISAGDVTIRDAMIFPPGATPDQSPLHVLCCNDTCSFTWTGADHINQDIFECRTCGLTGSLCCCTECAKVCHKGHECRLKRTSPTAYCDCWEKCKCKALIAGNQNKRYELLCKLARDTDLVARFNSRGESILLFLIQTVGRQMVEQRQYRASSRNRGSSSANSRKTPSLDPDTDMPEHDLEPPKFAKRALDRLLVDWPAVRAMIMTGAEQENKNATGVGGNSVFYEDSDNQSLYLHSQSGTTLLDKFTHSLFVRCNHEPLDTLLTTLIKELLNDQIPGRIDEAQKVARRFVRSVARVFVIFSIEKVPNLDKQRTSSSHSRYIQTCKRVFQALLKISIEELCETADALIAPVRLGVVRPTAPFSLSSNIDVMSNSEDLFSVEPLAPATSRQVGDILESGTSSSRGAVDNDQSSGFISRINLRMRDIEENNDADDLILAIGQDDGEISEQDDLSERETSSSQRQGSRSGGNNANNMEEEAQDPLVQEAESDTEFNFHEAETESDSDDNQSTQDAQRSVQTGATAGSDTGIGLLMLPTDDSVDSSQPDDDGSEDGETDDHSQEDYTLGEEQLERRTNQSSGPQRSNLAPQSMQWAIRSREANRSSGVRLASGSGLVFIDPTALRRSTAASAAVAAASQEPHTMATTASCLARAFGIVIRQISDLLGMTPDYPRHMSSMMYDLNLSYQEAVQLQKILETRLKPTWDWILTVMDATEAQLRFGASLTNSADPAHPLHPLHSPHHQSATGTTTTTSSISIGVLNPDGQNARREFLTYCLSLMRSHNSEHRDSLPVLDVTALKHVAYVLDALIYYMRGGAEIETDRTNDPSNIWNDQDENENEDNDDEFSNPGAIEIDSIEDIDMIGSMMGRRHSFFQRSESTLCLGCPAPDPFSTPMAEALPLADQPHLLQPSAKREDLFGMPKQPITLAANGSNSQLESLPTRLGLSQSSKQETDGLINLNDHQNAQSSETQSTGGVGDDIIMMEEKDGELDKKEKQRDDDIRPESPQAGPSMKVEQSSTIANKSENLEKMYMHLKKRNYYDFSSRSKSAPTAVETEESSNSNSLGDQAEEPQDLSCSKEASRSDEKMDVDSDEDFSDNEINEMKEEKLVEGNVDETAQDPSSIRPQIIVTPRKVAAAIESVTQSVLAKNKKASLSECVGPETPLNLLPTTFSMFDVPGSSNVGASTSTQVGGSGVTVSVTMEHCEDSASSQTTGGTNSSPSKSVIVRAGPSSCSNSEVLPIADPMESQEISAHVTVETTPTIIQNSIHQELPTRGLYFRQNSSNSQSVTSDLLLGRWRQSLDLFGRVFMEDVGMEPGSIVSELGGFPVKEVRFRRHMEKLRSNQQKDLTLSKMERNRTSLLVQTFKELNTQFGSQNRRINPPLAFNRVKVTFKDEPGEGSGVARSFYTSIAEALLANEKLPSLEAAQFGSSKYSVSFTSMLRPRSGSSREANNASSSSSSRKNVSSSSKTIWRPRENRKTLNYDARVYRPASQQDVSSAGSSSSTVAGGAIIATTNNVNDPSVPGGSSAVNQTGYTSNTMTAPSKKMNPIVLLEDYQVEDNAPLFYSPGKRGFYSPRQGYATFERINAFRNIGRLIGLCLLQNELFPLFLQRHVLKFILGRKIRFHDLAFFDPIIYESLRQLVKDSSTRNASTVLSTLELNFVIDLCPEEGGISLELLPGGRDIPVDETNVYDYVRKYAEFRMLKAQEKALEALRHGVFDVLPDGALDTLTAEDLRLLLNGVGDIHVMTLISYTTFNDESNASSEKLLKFKRWLWSIVEKMSNIERQDLVYFWTGSPALPASEDGFQPMPSVTIRPADDAHLPTANTCISRLYIPLYSSKAVLKHKLLLAIKTKNFGFV